MRNWLLTATVSFLLLMLPQFVAAQDCTGNNLIPEAGSTFGMSATIAQDGSPYVVNHVLENATGTPPDDGKYGFSRNTQTWGSFADFFWHEVVAPNGNAFSNDYFLVVNAAYGAQAFLRYEIELCPNTEYQINLDAVNMFQQQITGSNNDAGVRVPIVVPHLGAYINQQEVLDMGVVIQNEQWQAFGGKFRTPNVDTTLTLEIWNTTPGFISPTDPGNKDFGRDFAIDNIVVKECGIVPITIDSTICEGTFINLYGNTHDTAGTYRERGTFNGCQYDYTLNLSIAPRDTGNETLNFCGSGVYQGQTYTQSTTLPAQNLTNAAGCDSIVVVQINVSPTYDLDIPAQICSGEQVAGISIFQDTVFTIQATTLQGCDSLLNYDVRILPAAQENIVEQICAGQSFNFGASTLTSAGTYQQTFQTTDGCDSIVNLDLQILAEINMPVEVDICAGESYTFNGQTFTETTTIQSTATSFAGCDSITTLMLTVNEPTVNTLEIQLCEGESYQGIVYTQNETLTETLTNAANCDSLLTTQILVTPLYNDTIPSTICEGESVQGISIFQDTVLVFSETSLTGCDSITTMLVSVNPQKSNAFPWEICDGETYILGSQMLTQDGTYSETFQTTEGCDSLVTVNLTVLTTVNNAIDTTICSGQMYTFDGNSLTEAGTYTATEITPDGCEKITTLTLGVAQPTDSTLQIQICEGESYQGIVYTQNETLTETLTNAANCDSLLTTQILVTPLYNDTIPSAICEGESVQGIPIFQDTVLVFSETSLTGCDSITTMLVSVNPQKSNAFPWEICDGETYILGSQMLTQDGTYSETFQTTEGCDSLVTVNLTVLSTVNNAIDTTICSGQTYTFDGNSLTEAGTYTATETTPDGCEKITTLTLNIAQPTDSTLQIQICEGESLQGIVYTQNETLTETLTNAANCDSLLTTQILVTPLYNDTIPSTICEGESVQGIPIFQDTVLVFSETSATGCDSITTLLVRVNNDQTNTFATEICEGETYVLGNQSLSTSGTYTELFQTTEGCDSLVTVELSFLTTVEATLEATICAGETYLFDGQDLAENGVYTASQITPNGCDSTTTLSLTIEDAFLLDLGEDQIVSLGDTVQLAATNANGIIFYEWESDSPLSCFDCPNPSLTVEGSTSVRLTATNTANCQSEATVNFRLKDYEIYQPTAFSPNDDGVNELFELGFGQDVNIVRRFLIFDRWGNELYSVEMVAPDSPDLSWNGYFKDVLLDKGIYIWIAEVEFTDSTVKQFASEVLLMR